MKKTKITIYGKEYTTKTNTRFVAYSYKKDGKFYDVRFRKTCSTRPTAKGYLDIEIDAEATSIQHRDQYSPILWIGEVYSIKKSEGREGKSANQEVLDILGVSDF